MLKQLSKLERTRNVLILGFVGTDGSQSRPVFPAEQRCEPR
jgi:hypothetical protein